MLKKPAEIVELNECSPLALAFVGDGVLELLVRSRLVATRRISAGALHREAVKLVSARAQADLLAVLEPYLTDEEKDLVRRGRNASKATVSKNATAWQYRASTGLEAMLGWLYLQNRLERIDELFEHMWQHHLQAGQVRQPEV